MSAARCDLRQGVFCAGMESRIQPVNDPSPGLSRVEAVDTETHQIVLQAVRFKAARADKGILLNYCPWCAARVRFDAPVARSPKFPLYPTKVSWALWRAGFPAANADYFDQAQGRWVRGHQEGYRCLGTLAGVEVTWRGERAEAQLQAIQDTLARAGFVTSPQGAAVLVQAAGGAA